MKKSILMMVLGITMFISGCGNENVNTPDESQVIEGSESQTREELDDYMNSIKEQSDSIKDFIENDALTQMDMNEKSQELYELWDGALNDLWSELKNSLSEEDFSNLLDEQRVWIQEKENSVEEAGKEVEGGSMYPLVVNMEAARITEERVYELYELLK